MKLNRKIKFIIHRVRPQKMLRPEATASVAPAVSTHAHGGFDASLMNNDTTKAYFVQVHYLVTYSAHAWYKNVLIRVRVNAREQL
jgi:hypothetical protein